MRNLSSSHRSNRSRIHTRSHVVAFGISADTWGMMFQTFAVFAFGKDTPSMPQPSTTLQCWLGEVLLLQAV